MTRELNIMNLKYKAKDLHYVVLKFNKYYIFY
jgi:hypothetical protein